MSGLLLQSLTESTLSGDIAAALALSDYAEDSGLALIGPAAALAKSARLQAQGAAPRQVFLARCTVRGRMARDGRTGRIRARCVNVQGAAEDVAQSSAGDGQWHAVCRNGGGVANA